MKATEYAEKIRQRFANPPMKSAIFTDVPKAEDGPADRQDIIIDTCYALLAEGRAMVKARRITQAASYSAVILELDQKWRAIVARVGDSEISELTFLAFLNAYEKAHPDLLG